MRNNGYYRELELIEKFNGKDYNQLDEKMKIIIDEIFDEKKGRIISGKCRSKSKPDIFIEINGVRKLISIKSGNSNSLHFEGIKDFVLFLRSLGVSARTQKTVLLFQYGDGTMDGTGQTRLNHEKLMIALGKEISLANRELDNPDIIRNSVQRFFFTGGYDNDEAHVDYVLFVDNNDYYLASADQLTEYALKEDYRYISTLHIGPIIIYPYLRDIERKSKKEYKRNIVHCKWINLKKTVREISAYQK